jgi:hypothetical protein
MFLQKIVFPKINLVAEESLYFRYSSDFVDLESSKLINYRYSEISCDLSRGELKLNRGSTFSTDTFYNGFSIEPWKSTTNIKSLCVCVEGKGRFKVRVGLHNIGMASKWLIEQECHFNDIDKVDIDIKDWRSLPEGLLFFSVEALDDCEILGGGWFTNDEPVIKPKLGVVVTHFNRQEYVLPAIKRIQNELLSDREFKNNIELIVVDNSKNLDTEEFKNNVRVIPNENLGGSGGFTRGLMYLEDHQFTHCLFMDDDASCEIESIRRTYILLSYAIDQKTAIAGSLLRELEPYRLFEKGAMFDGLCRPLKSGLDMRRINDLLLAEVEDKKPSYGGWWFFAFNISEIKYYPFPFFVRGDDIMFGMLNNFNIKTMNGISCWGEDFGLKSGPLPIYLDVRNHLLQKLTHLNSSYTSISSLYFKFLLTSLFSYNYATARAVNKAFSDFLIGPSFWLANIDTSKIRADIASFSSSEKMLPISRADYAPVYASPEEKLGRKLIRLLLLNGHLLPSFLLNDAVVYQHKSFRGRFREIFGFKHVLYEYEPLPLGYIATHDKSKFFKEFFVAIKNLFKFFIRSKTLKKQYQNALPEMTSRDFWEKVYDQRNKG